MRTLRSGDLDLHTPGMNELHIHVHERRSQVCTGNPEVASMAMWVSGAICCIYMCTFKYVQYAVYMYIQHDRLSP